MKKSQVYLKDYNFRSFLILVEPAFQKKNWHGTVKIKESKVDVLGKQSRRFEFGLILFEFTVSESSLNHCNILLQVVWAFKCSDEENALSVLKKKTLWNATFQFSLRNSPNQELNHI